MRAVLEYLIMNNIRMQQASVIDKEACSLLKLGLH